jgi:uncharacterized protein YndB with AHSA1/START domain
MDAMIDRDVDTADREMVITRLIAAPQELVFEAWTDPAHLAAWWGPDGFTTTTSAFDMRPGGVWRFVMHGPDGRDYENRITFEEVVRPERLVYRHSGGEDVEPVRFITTVTFVPEDGKIRVTLRAVFPTAATTRTASPMRRSSGPSASSIATMMATTSGRCASPPRSPSCPRTARPE